MKMDKKTLHIITVLWVVFSVFYIANDQWTNFKEGEMKAAYQRGIADSVMSLMKESAKCEPIVVFAQDEEVKLIPLECLEKRSDE